MLYGNRVKYSNVGLLLYHGKAGKAIPAGDGQEKAGLVGRRAEKATTVADGGSELSTGSLRAQTWVPEGLTDLYYPATAWRRGLEVRLASHLEERGYHEVNPCLLETWGEPVAAPPEAVLRVLDEQGRVLALRSDFTPAVARVGGSLLRHQGAPIRLWYAGPVFRRRSPRQVRGTETYQVGAELLGAEAGAEREMLSLAAGCLRAAGLREFACVVGHSDLPATLLAREGLPAATVGEALAFLREEDLVGFQRLLERWGVPSRRWRRLIEAAEHDAAHAAHAAAQAEAADAAATPLQAELAEVVRWAEGLFPGGVRLCPGLVPRPQYYDGPVFELYASVGRRKVGSGGRYRLELPAEDGSSPVLSVPGVGFALDIEELTMALAQEGQAPASLRAMPTVVPCGIH
ncbi:MAG TPA: hypothetical protein GX513_01270 [Firmicutes bacterium]|nr:hypothetical protein [Bacillota bacterium]